MKKLRPALLGALALTLLLTGQALAHAKFVKSEPAPDSVLTVAPAAVTIWFSEELDTKASVIKVLDGSGAQVDLGNSKVNLDDRKQLSVGLKPLGSGTYTVKWHVVADDDKGESDGDFKFTVQAALQATPTALPPTSQPTTPPPTATPTPTAIPPTATPPPATPTSLPLPTQTPTAGATGADLALPLMALSVVVLAAGAFLVLRKK
ncbi:MAG: copper resistance protein CopC [Chloroflexi bacterium]|nr:copper resistance protein CopC [Chloroflexota bacterium]MBI3732807.1 copper resistance protein CopC [Chloroflexota bacterium]